MPLYAYKCESCGFSKDVLQKMSAAPLTQCPSCGADAFRKQVTAAGFQLKGSGWYVTDFRGGNSGAKPAGDKSDSSGKDAPAAASDSAATPAAPAAAPSASTPAAAPAATPASAPASPKTRD